MYVIRERYTWLPLSDPIGDIEKAIDIATWLGNCHLCHRSGVVIMTIDRDRSIVGEICMISHGA